MRLPLIVPADLSLEQRPVYEDMRAGIERSFQGFKSIAENGAGGTDLFGRTVLPCVGHAKRIRRAGTGAMLRVIGRD